MPWGQSATWWWRACLPWDLLLRSEHPCSWRRPHWIVSWMKMRRRRHKIFSIVHQPTTSTTPRRPGSPGAITRSLTIVSQPCVDKAQSLWVSPRMNACSWGACPFGMLSSYCWTRSALGARFRKGGRRWVVLTITSPKLYGMTGAERGWSATTPGSRRSRGSSSSVQRWQNADHSGIGILSTEDPSTRKVMRSKKQKSSLLVRAFTTISDHQFLTTST